MSATASNSTADSGSHLRCSRCDHISPPDSSYCASCGADLADSGVPLAMEPTQVHPQVGADAAGSDMAPPRMEGRLVVQEGAKAGMVFTLNDTITSIGRHPESDIFLSDLTVSRRHAEVLANEGGFEVRDVGSLNGTYLNRQRVDSAQLQDNDVVQVGRFKLEYQAPAVPPAPQQAQLS